MANITLSDYGTVGAAVSGIDLAKFGKPTTSTASITPTFSSVTRVASPALSPTNFNIADLTPPALGGRRSDRGVLTGRRPTYGLLFPRGYYNR